MLNVRKLDNQTKSLAERKPKDLNMIPKIGQALGFEELQTFI
jgi:hypothetical protein